MYVWKSEWCRCFGGNSTSRAVKELKTVKRKKLRLRGLMANSFKDFKTANF